MERVQDHLKKLREERLAREKARIEKLRELNLKKYNSGPQMSKSSTKSSTLTKRPESAPIKNVPIQDGNKKTIAKTTLKPNTKLLSNVKDSNKDVQPRTQQPVVSESAPKVLKKKIAEIKPNILKTNKEVNKLEGVKSMDCRKSIAVISHTYKHNNGNPSKESKLPKPLEKADVKMRQSMIPKQNNGGKHESVFDRLYKPKAAPKAIVENDAKKLKTDQEYLRKVIRSSNLIINKRHTMFEPKKQSLPMRRSISAVHLKRMSKNELSKCVHKWASIGEKINEHINEIDEDDSVQENKIVSAVKSERKRVKFQTPTSFNTPKPAELQARLKNWLQRHGKSLDSYHHLQCFGLHHMATDIRSPGTGLDLNDEENKENIALDHDSDNESYTENVNDLNDDIKNNFEMDKWRRASCVSDSPCNESLDTTLSSPQIVRQVDELLTGALQDLTRLLREGFDWEQCARWLRAIREQFPDAPEGAAYWECRAALEETRGDLPATMQCWERAIANGTEQAVAEANLDMMLDKFMQLKISPSSGRSRPADQRLLDVKNVFKSTIIRFAVQQAKLRQSNGTPMFTVTPVRRSSRLSHLPRATPTSKPTPVTKTTPTATPSARSTRALQIISTFHQAAELFPVEFKPNKALIKTP